MICHVDQITKNLRYKVLNINEDFYILDMNQSILMFLFPFFFWFTPHKIDKTIANRVKKEDSNKERSLSTSGFVGVIVILGMLIRPLVDYYNFRTFVEAAESKKDK